MTVKEANEKWNPMFKKVSSKGISLTSIQKNINFLEYPLFFPSKTKLTEWELNGYEIECKSLGLPGVTDINMLNVILHLAQATSSPIVKFTNFRDIVESAGYSRRSFTYEEIMNVLHRWKNTRVSFKKFYDNKEYKKKSFNKIITQLYHNDTNNSLTVTLNNEFYLCQSNKFSKTISLPMFYDLSPTAKRIYEVLTKTFYKRTKWVVGCETFLNKIPIMNDVELSVNKFNLHRYMKEINKNLILYGKKYIFTMNLLKEMDLIVFNLVQFKK